MWSLAHEQGIALPTRDYWEFDRMVTVSDPRGVPDLDSLDRIYHLTELIQSSPLAVERSVHSAIGGAYRSQRITTLELRFNPMKRNRGRAASASTTRRSATTSTPRAKPASASRSTSARRAAGSGSRRSERSRTRS